MIADTAQFYSGFFECFAANRILNGLPRFEKTSKAREHSRAEMRAAAKKTTVVLFINRQHDHHGVGTGKELLVALLAAPPVSAALAKG